MDHGHEASSMPNGRRRVALHKAHLTTRTVADASLRDRRYIVWDDELAGFGVRISPSGLRSFIVQYRAREGGRRAASRKKVLGHFPALTPARARSRAREVLRAVAERRANGEGSALPIPTLRHALEGYLRGRPALAPNTRSQYRRRFERHAPQWLDRRLDELGREDVERRFLELSEHAGPSVANGFVKLLGAVYRAPCADHDELRNPASEWRMGGGKVHRAKRRTIAPLAEVLPPWRRGLEAGVPAVMCDMDQPDPALDPAHRSRELDRIAAQRIARRAAARGLLGVRHHLFDLIEGAREPCGQAIGQQAEGGVALRAVPASDSCPARGLARVGAVAGANEHPPCG